MNFTDKVVLVTGASSGIGAAIAIKFAAQGAKVAIVGRNKTKLDSVNKQCEDNGNKALAFIADISDDNDAKRIVNETIQHFGKLDILVNNAAIVSTVGILGSDTMEGFDRVMATNLRAPVYLTHLAAPYLIETKGNIINISSIAALKTTFKNTYAYDASKACLDHFSRCVALELASKGVRVNTISPGPVRTDAMVNAGYDEAAAQRIWEKLKKLTPLDRISEPAEIADLVLFVASDLAKSITGSTYVIDNGACFTGSAEL